MYKPRLYRSLDHRFRHTAT